MDVKKFGLWLKEMRKSRSLSTHELSNLSGVSQSYISHLESGRKKGMPSPEILKKLSVPLKVSYPELMRRAGYLDDGSLIVNDKLIPPEVLLHETFGVFTTYGFNFNGVSFNEEQAKAIDQLLKKNQIKTELIDILKTSDITYRGFHLTDQDRKRILGMLELMFPDYQEE